MAPKAIAHRLAILTRATELGEHSIVILFQIFVALAKLEENIKEPTMG
jgi:hypothetical protein